MIRAAEDALGKIYPEVYGEFSSGSPLVDFNDSVRRTAEEVAQLFETVADMVKEETP